MHKYLLAISALLLIFISSCLKKVDVDNTDHSVSLTYDTVRVAVGSVTQLSSKHYTAGQLQWSSSDTSIATVSNTGWINAKRLGTTVVNVKSTTYAVSATCVIMVTTAPVTILPSGSYSKLDVKGTDISIGADGSIYIVGSETLAGTGGYGVFKLTGNTLTKLPDCGAVRIAVSPKGLPWVVTKNNQILRYNGTSWDTMPGTATDIGIGADGSVFATSTTVASPTGGYGIMKWNGTGWDTLPDCAGVRIAVAPDGTPWVVNKSNIVYYYSGTYLWYPVSNNLANDIGIGTNGAVYITGFNSSGNTAANASIYKFASGGWLQLPDATGINITVSPQGNPWWIDASNAIYKQGN